MLILSKENIPQYLQGIIPKIPGWENKTKIITVEEITEQTYVNYIFRAEIEIAEEKQRLYVYLRQTRDHVKTKPERKLEPDRIQFEARILGLLNKINAGVNPRVIFLDAENNVAVLSDIKRGCPLLVEELIRGNAHPETGKFFGKTIGKFHCATLGISHAEVRGTAEMNKEAVDFHLGMRLEPALRMFPETTNKLLTDSEKAQKCLVLGDLASKNIFVDGNKVRFLDLERAFIGDPAFDLAFLFCHYLIEITPDKIKQSLKFIKEFMAGYKLEVAIKLSTQEIQQLKNRVIRFLGITVLYRLFGFYLVVNVERNKKRWTEIAEKLLAETKTTSLPDCLEKYATNIELP